MAQENLHRLKEIIAVENNKRFVGRTLTVLVDGESKKRPGMLTGRSSENMLVEFPGEPSLIGQFVNVEINASHSGMVSGERTD